MYFSFDMSKYLTFFSFSADTQMYVKGSLKKYLRDGVEYFRVNKINAKITVGDGHIRMDEKNKDMQYAGEHSSDVLISS